MSTKGHFEAAYEFLKYVKGAYEAKAKGKPLWDKLTNMSRRFQDTVPRVFIDMFSGAVSAEIVRYISNEVGREEMMDPSSAAKHADLFDSVLSGLSTMATIVFVYANEGVDPADSMRDVIADMMVNYEGNRDVYFAFVASRLLTNFQEFIEEISRSVDPITQTFVN